MENKRNYYDVLGINKNSNSDEIKMAYRKLAKKYHPDVSKEKNAESKFKEIGEAYEILSDPNKKRIYDQFGHTNFDYQNVNNNFNSSDIFNNNNFNDFSSSFSGFSDIFEQFFNNGKTQTYKYEFNNKSAKKGEDIAVRTNISLKEMMFGTNITLDLTLDKICEICHGTGAQNNKDIHMCTTCSGKGYVNTQKHSLFGIIQIQKSCPDCKGKGKVIIHKCNYCHGKKHYIGKEKIKIEIPKSILPGQQLKIKEKAHYGINGGTRGDIYVEIGVKPNKFYKRINNDLYLDLPINYLDALLGGEIIIPALDGNIK